MRRGTLYSGVVLLVVLLVPGRLLHAHMFGDGPSHAPAARESLDTEVSDHLRRYSAEGNDDLLIQARHGIVEMADSAAARGALYAAWLAQAEHRFVDAIQHMREVHEQAPTWGAGWLMSANLFRITGDYPLARQACAHTAPDLPIAVSLGCQAEVTLAEHASNAATQDRTRHGGKASSASGLTQTRVRLDRLARLAGAMPGEPGLAAWLHGVIAALDAADGDHAKAAGHLRVALALHPTVQTRATLARTLRQGGDAEAALAVIPAATSVPALLLNRLLALKALDRLEAHGALVAALDAQFRADIAAGDVRHAREMAQFYLAIAPDFALARHLAQANWRTQREPLDAELLLVVRSAAARQAPR